MLDNIKEDEKLARQKLTEKRIKGKKKIKAMRGDDDGGVVLGTPSEDEEMESSEGDSDGE